jgi:hypothetical protein
MFLFCLSSSSDEVKKNDKFKGSFNGGENKMATYA